MNKEYSPKIEPVSNITMNSYTFTVRATKFGLNENKA